jgi:predicted enzyme related to lactoylglutathione lyase
MDLLRKGCRMSQNFTIDLVEFPANSPEDLQKATTFYHEVFGWNFKEWGDEYSDTHDSGVASGFNTGDPDTRQTMPLAVIYADDLDAAAKKVRNAGATIIHEIYSFPGGRRFHFADPAGNELAIWGK